MFFTGLTSVEENSLLSSHFFCL